VSKSACLVCMNPLVQSSGSKTWSWLWVKKNTTQCGLRNVSWDGTVFWLCFVYVVLKFQPRSSCLLPSWPTAWATKPAPFCFAYFQHRVSRIIFQGWLWTLFVLNSDSWVARITGMTYQHQFMVNLTVQKQHQRSRFFISFYSTW
jgi:hypothetical protein